MNTDTWIWVFIGASLVVGFTWGRVSGYVRMPEILRLLTAPALMGVLSVALGGLTLLYRCAENPAIARYVLALPVLSWLRMSLGYGMLLFVAGSALGLPAVLTWALGYRRPNE